MGSLTVGAMLVAAGIGVGLEGVHALEAVLSSGTIEYPLASSFPGMFDLTYILLYSIFT